MWTSSDFHLGFGFTASSSLYTIASEENDEQSSVDKQGEMTGFQYGPTFSMSLPWVITPYVSSTLLVGDFDYELQTTTSQTSGSSQLGTDLKTKLSFISNSIAMSFGLRSAGTWSFFGEAAVMRTLLTLSQAKAVATNRVDGEVVSSDTGEASLSELFQELEGEKFHHSTSVVVFGVARHF
jgi:hypothetical protein